MMTIQTILSSEFIDNLPKHPSVKGWLDSFKLKQTLPPLQEAIFDFSGFTSLEKKVYRELLKIPYGAVCSYQQLASKVGIEKGARFIGNVMKKNPYPIIFPCHRVIKSDGTLGGFGGGGGNEN